MWFRFSQTAVANPASTSSPVPGWTQNQADQASGLGFNLAPSGNAAYSPERIGKIVDHYLEKGDDMSTVMGQVMQPYAEGSELYNAVQQVAQQRIQAFQQRQADPKNTPAQVQTLNTAIGRFQALTAQVQRESQGVNFMNRKDASIDGSTKEWIAAMQEFEKILGGLYTSAPLAVLAKRQLDQAYVAIRQQWIGFIGVVGQVLPQHIPALNSWVSRSDTIYQHIPAAH